jgi:hypothetical protein
MTHYCLDACSLINLFCGWGGIQELHAFGDSWSTSRTALAEFTEIREFCHDGSIIRRPIDEAAICRGSPLCVHSATGEDELATLSRLSMVIDDGEAECLAVAKHRSLILVSDDGLAVKQADKEGVPAVSSIQLLVEWSNLDATRKPRLREIASRIELLAKYVPPPQSPHRAWWNSL